MSSTRERDGALLCVLAAASSASLIVMARLAYEAGADPLTLLPVRFALAAIVLWPLALRAGALRRITRGDAIRVLTLGAAVYSVQTWLTFVAIERIGGSLTELLLFAFPSLVVLGELALGRERVSRRRLAALVLASSGIVLVLAGGAGGTLDPLGIACALGGAVGYAIYLLSSAPVLIRVPPVALVAIVSSGASVFLGTAAAATGSLRLDLGGDVWALTLGLALLPTIVAFTAFFGGVRRIGASRASILVMLEPPIACALAFLAFDERLTALQIAGGALVVGGAIVLQVRSRSRGAPARTADPAAAGALAPAAAD